MVTGESSDLSVFSEAFSSSWTLCIEAYGCGQSKKLILMLQTHEVHVKGCTWHSLEASRTALMAQSSWCPYVDGPADATGDMMFLLLELEDFRAPPWRWLNRLAHLGP